MIFDGNVGRFRRFALPQGSILEEDIMKLRIALATIVAAAVALPAIASAETTVIKKYGDRDHFRGARAEFHHDRGWHRGWDRHHGARTVIIKRHMHRD